MLQCTKPIALLAERNRHVAQCLGRLISHVELLKTVESFCCQLCRVVVGIQLQVNLREVKLAKGGVVCVACCLGSLARSLQPINGPSICPTLVMKVSDVVFGLGPCQGHIKFLAELVGLLVSALGLLVFI